MDFTYTRIGIVGVGYVGSAVKAAFEDQLIDLVLVDNDPSRGTKHTYADLMSCEGVFICVPSPQGDDGSCDTSILESVLSNLKDYEGVIISKCTAPPLVYKELGKKYRNLVHAPEFLTAANAVQDYMNGKFSIIGGSVRAYQNEAERLISLSQPRLEHIHHCSLEEASLTKYAINAFLATKVSFMNEMAQVSTSVGASYNKIASMMVSDKRIGTSHMKVPGPDGLYGFGGACFPKDTSALLKIAEERGVDMQVLKGAVSANKVLRKGEIV